MAVTTLELELAHAAGAEYDQFLKNGVPESEARQKVATKYGCTTGAAYTNFRFYRAVRTLSALHNVNLIEMISQKKVVFSSKSIVTGLVKHNAYVQADVIFHGAQAPPNRTPGEKTVEDEKRRSRLKPTKYLFNEGRARVTELQEWLGRLGILPRTHKHIDAIMKEIDDEQQRA